MSDIISKIPSSMLVNDTSDAAQVNKALLNQVQGSNKIIDAVNTVNAAVTAVGSGIVELGTNSNGTYVKWGNGLMVCTGWKYWNIALSTGTLTAVSSPVYPVAFTAIYARLISDGGYRNTADGVPTSPDTATAGDIALTYHIDDYGRTKGTDMRVVVQVGPQYPATTAQYQIFTFTVIGTWK